MTSPFGAVARAAVQPLLQRAARAYWAGPRLADAMSACRRYAVEGRATALCYWNESGEGARAVSNTYLAALDALAGEALDCYLSIKAPPIGYSTALFAEILGRARTARIRVHFDSLDPGAVDRTLELAETAAPGPTTDIGITLPGRWNRSPADAEWAIERRAPVRVVKGQWEDPEDPGRDPRRGFLAVIDRLAGRAAHVAVASHDATLVREALRRLRSCDTSCELELLYGLPFRRVLSLAREASVPARFYVPYGFAWLPYSLAEFRRRPHVAWWLLKDALRQA